MTLIADSSLQAAAALAAVGATPLVFAADTLQDRLRLAADRAARALRRGRQVGHRADEDGLQGRHQRRRQEVRRADRAEGQPVQPEPRGRGGQRPDPEGQGRADAHRRHARDRQPGERCLRAQRGALHLERGAVAALVLRPQGRSGQGLRLDVPHVLGPRGRHRQLHQRLEDACRPTRRSAACSPTTATATRGATRNWAFRSRWRRWASR